MRSYLTKKMCKGKWIQHFQYSDDMDQELIELMDVLNSIPGCRTLYSCWGHGGIDASSWYFVVHCCNGVTYSLLREYFGTRNFEVDEDQAIAKQELPSGIPEKKLAIYSSDLGMKSEIERWRTYKSMCQDLIQLVPPKSWK